MALLCCRLTYPMYAFTFITSLSLDSATINICTHDKCMYWPNNIIMHLMASMHGMSNVSLRLYNKKVIIPCFSPIVLFSFKNLPTQISPCLYNINLVLIVKKSHPRYHALLACINKCNIWHLPWLVTPITSTPSSPAKIKQGYILPVYKYSTTQINKVVIQMHFTIRQKWTCMGSFYRDAKCEKEYYCDPNCACAIDHKHEMAATNYSQYSEYTPPAPEGKLHSFSQY